MYIFYFTSRLYQEIDYPEYPEEIERPRFEGDILGMATDESRNPDAEHNALSSQDSR